MGQNFLQNLSALQRVHELMKRSIEEIEAISPENAIHRIAAAVIIFHNNILREHKDRTGEEMQPHAAQTFHRNAYEAVHRAAIEACIRVGDRLMDNIQAMTDSICVEELENAGNGLVELCEMMERFAPVSAEDAKTRSRFIHGTAEIKGARDILREAIERGIQEQTKLLEECPNMEAEKTTIQDLTVLAMRWRTGTPRAPVIIATYDTYEV